MRPYCTAQEGVFFLDNGKVRVQNAKGEARDLLSIGPEFDNGVLSVNAAGTLLAVASHDVVEVWILGSKYDASRRVWRSDSSAFKGDIIATKWHPCARTNAGLVVLTSTHLVSVYIPLGQEPIIERTELKDDTNLGLDPVGFGFGAEDAPLGPVTVYVGTNDGDIYRLLWFVPPEIEVSAEQLELLREYASLDSWQVGPESWSDERHGAVTVLKRDDESLPRTLRNIEALKLAPYPSDLYTETTLDVSTGSIGWATDVVVQTSDRFVNLYALPEPHADTLVLVSSVKFKAPETQRQVEHISSQYVFVATDQATHVLDISALTEMKHSNEHSNEHSNDSGTSKPTRAAQYPLQRIYRTARAFVSIDSDLKWPLHQTSKTARPAALESRSDLGTQAAGDEEGVQSYLKPVSRAETVASVDAIQKGLTPPPFIPQWGPNLGSLVCLNVESQRYQQAIILLAKQLAVVNLERQAQAREVAGQTTELQELSELMEKTASRLPSLGNKLEEARKRQTELRNRLEAVANNISKLESSRPDHPPSQQEEAWFAELKDKLAPKLESTYSEIERLSESLNALKDSSEQKGTIGSGSTTSTGQAQAPSRLSPSQVMELRWRLKSQDSLITSLLSKVK